MSTQFNRRHKVLHQAYRTDFQKKLGFSNIRDNVQENRTLLSELNVRRLQKNAHSEQINHSLTAIQSPFDCCSLNVTQADLKGSKVTL